MIPGLAERLERELRQLVASSSSPALSPAPTIRVTPVSGEAENKWQQPLESNLRSVAFEAASTIACQRILSEKLVQQQEDSKTGGSSSNWITRDEWRDALAKSGGASWDTSQDKPTALLLRSRCARFGAGGPLASAAPPK